MNIITTIGALGCMGIAAYIARPDEPRAGTPVPRGFAVVELFTSEGCSSCPPADEALIELLDKSQRDGRAVIALGFHVDYWNRLGWKDPFSDARWSERQRIYSTRTSDNVYTPQVVVNGKRSFVGSDRSDLESNVHDALRSGAMNIVEARVEQVATSVIAHYTIGGDLSGKELVAVLTEAGLGTHVRAGENNGRRLNHAPVVRALKALVLNEEGSTGEVTIDASEVKDPANAQLVLLVQGRGQGAIFGACRAAMATH